MDYESNDSPTSVDMDNNDLAILADGDSNNPTNLADSDSNYPCTDCDSKDPTTLTQPKGIYPSISTDQDSNDDSISTDCDSKDPTSLDVNSVNFTISVEPGSDFLTSSTSVDKYCLNGSIEPNQANQGTREDTPPVSADRDRVPPLSRVEKLGASTIPVDGTQDDEDTPTVHGIHNETTAIDLISPNMSPATSRTEDSSQELHDFNPQWSNDLVDISCLAKRGGYSLPCVALIQVDSDHSDQTVPTDRGNKDVTFGPLLMYDAIKGMRVEARCLQPPQSHGIEIKEVGPKLILPANYPGWFYLLDESGKPPKSYTTVGQAIASLGVQPSSDSRPISMATDPVSRTKTVLSCSPLIAYLVQSSSRQYKHCTVTAGQELVFHGIKPLPKAIATSNDKDADCCNPLNWLLSRRRLKSLNECAKFSDGDGRKFLICLDQPGKFYTMGRPGSENTGRVYQLSDILQYKALPMELFLVSGPIPELPSDTFSGYMRIRSRYFEELIHACTLTSDSPHLLEIPVSSEIKFKIANNWSMLEIDNVVTSAMEFCEESLEAHALHIKVLHNMYGEDPGRKEAHGGNLDKRGSFLIRERALPPLPLKQKNRGILRSRGQSHSSSYADVVSFHAESEVDCQYEKIPFHRMQSQITVDINSRYSHGAVDAVVREQSQMCECNEEAGYLLPVETEHIIQAHRKQQDDQDSGSEPNDALPYSSELTESQVLPFEETLLNSAGGNQEVSKGHGSVRFGFHMNDQDRLEAFLRDSLKHLEAIKEMEQRAEQSNMQTRDNISSCVPSLQDTTDDAMPRVVNVQPTTGSPQSSEQEPDFSLVRRSQLDNNATRSDSGISNSITYSYYHKAMQDLDTPTDVGFLSLNECSWLPPADLCTLTMEEVSLCLRLIGMRPNIIGLFLKEQIDGKQLTELDDCLLREGFPQLNALERKKILDFIGGWRPKRWLTSIPAPGEVDV